MCVVSSVLVVSGKTLLHCFGYQLKETHIASLKTNLSAISNKGLFFVFQDPLSGSKELSSSCDSVIENAEVRVT